MEENNTKDEKQGLSKRQRLGQILAIAGLVLGIFTLLVAFVPFVGVFAAIPGIFAFGASLTAVLMARRGSAPPAVSTVALALAVLGLLIAIVWGMIFFQATKKRPEPSGPAAREDGMEMVYHYTSLENTLFSQPAYCKDSPGIALPWQGNAIS